MIRMGSWCVIVTCPRASSRSLVRQHQTPTYPGEPDKASNHPLAGPGQLTDPATVGEKVHVSSEIVPGTPAVEGASATPSLTPQGSSSGQKNEISGPITDAGPLTPDLPKLLKLAHATYLLPPCTITNQRRCACASPKVYSERSLYIEKEAVFRRSLSAYKKSQRAYVESMRELRLFEALLQAPDNERLPVVA